MRNNQDRLGGATTQSAAQEPPIQQQEQAQQQPLQFVTPTEFVELPSAGRFYPEGHPLHACETIEIRHMTAKDEDILTSRSLLKKGVAIDRLLQNVIVDRKVRVDDLLIGDKNAIIVACRISGYGPSYEAGVVCPSCTTSVEFNFDLNQCGVIPHDSHSHWGIEKTPENTFIIHVDKLGVDVELRLLTSRDETALAQQSEKRRKNKLPESGLTDQIRRMIVSVNGNNNPGYIDSFIEALPAIDSRKIRRTYQKIVPNIDMIQGFTCSACDFEGGGKCAIWHKLFGLSNDYMQEVYEQFFLLKYHGGWSFIEAYNLPVGLRTWFVKRLAKQFEEEKKQYDKASPKKK